MADNPWPGGITEQTWWFSEQCLALGGVFGGIYADKPGFHNTVVNNLAKYPNNYSIALPILKVGPRDKARAFDWVFPEAKTKNFFRINLYSARMDVASRAQDPRLRGLYEWFGTRDGANIGWNVYKNVFSSSDDTHDWHMHFSWVTAWLLDWAGPQGVISVLRGETLVAYLARGGKLIGQGAQSEGQQDMTMFVQIKTDPEPRAVAKSDGFEWEHLTSNDALQAALAAGYKLITVPNMAAFNALCGTKRVPDPPVNITLTPEQIALIVAGVTSSLKKQVLRPLADAAQAEATTLDTAAE